ncbi:MAG TPA: FtsQ-type POTRA domain-containing protein [Vicinamibacterales bacterium]
MSAVAIPADKRFRRAHVKPGRRRRHWRAVVVPVARYAFIGAVIAFSMYEVSGIAAQAHALRIEKISIRGNERLSKAEVARALDGMVGQSLVWTNLDHWRDQLLKSPWIHDAAMRRSLPSTIEVVVSERRPMGIGRLRGELFLVDEHGVILDRYGTRYADFDLPIIDGLVIHEANGVRTAGEAGAELASRVIAALKARSKISERLSQVDVSDLHNAAVILTGDTAVVHLGEDQFLQRVESYLDLAPALRERVADIDYVDLRFDDRIYVRPSGKKAK